jgi:hypothetical protein
MDESGFGESKGSSYKGSKKITEYWNNGIL